MKFFLCEGDYYLKIIEKDTLFYERKFEFPDWCLERHKSFYGNSNESFKSNSRKRKCEPNLFFKNDEEYFNAYKEAGGTVYLNRDRYNEVVKKIEEKLLEYFDHAYAYSLHPYDKGALKKLNPETQEIIEKQLASIILVTNKDEIVLAFDVDARPFLYLENSIWHRFDNGAKVLKGLCTRNFIRIMGDGTLLYNNRMTFFNLWSSSSVKRFVDYFKKVNVLDSWNYILGEMDLFLKDDRYPNVELPRDLNRYVVPNDVFTDDYGIVGWPLEVRNHQKRK